MKKGLVRFVLNLLNVYCVGKEFVVDSTQAEFMKK